MPARSWPGCRRRWRRSGPPASVCKAKIRKLQEELTRHYGAFEDLPDDFPERLQLFATQQRDLTALSTELEGIGQQIAALNEEISRTYPRFVRFGDNHAERLHAVEAQEKETKKELRELELEHSMVVDTQSRLKKLNQTLLNCYAAFESVAEDFPSRLRSYRSLLAEYETKKSQSDGLITDIEAIETELARDFRLMHGVGPDYGNHIDAARVMVGNRPTQAARPAHEPENVQRLLGELEEINGVLKGACSSLITAPMRGCRSGCGSIGGSRTSTHYKRRQALDPAAIEHE